MTAYSSVVSFVASALAEEFVNNGVLAYGDRQVRGKFLDNWNRVEMFANSERLLNARAFQDWVEQSMVTEGPSDQRTKRLDEVILRKIALEWHGSIQITEPRASLLDPDALLEDVAP